MDATSAPTLDLAHEHANNAESYNQKGLLIPAAEEHYKAAEAFKACVDLSTDEHLRNTLRNLHARHAAQGKDLQRRISRFRDEGKDPAQPQLSPAMRPNHPASAHGASRNLSSPANALGSGASSPLRGRTLDSSGGTFDESFMMLNQQTDPSGEESPFDLFWKVTAEIMVNLSQPTPFQTAAMAALEAVESRQRDEADEDAGEPSTRASATLKNGSAGATSASTSNNGKSSHVANNKDEEEDDYVLDSDDSSDSFCMVGGPSRMEVEARPNPAVLRKENEKLKGQMDALQKQVASMRRQMMLRAEQDQQLKDHIMLARKEAQRAMSASLAPRQSLMDFAGLNLNAPPAPSMPGALPTATGAGAGARDLEARNLRRIRELEEEVRGLKIDNEKQRAIIAKFRDRWERLKESAKRKKTARSMGSHGSGDGVRERIDEEPEAEEAAAEEARRGSP